MNCAWMVCEIYGEFILDEHKHSPADDDQMKALIKTNWCIIPVK